MKIQNVHDKFFKETFSRIDIATNFLEELLEQNLIQQMNLSTLQMDNNSFVDEELEEHFADILYTCDYGQKSKIRIALLYEHKSYKEDYPHWQLNQYMLNVWKSGLKQNKYKPIPVIPIILYHGRDKWSYQSMASYFDNIDENLVKYIPDFDYHLINLNDISDKRISNFKNKFLAISALLFKYSRYKKYVKKIEDNLVDLLKLVDNQGSSQFVTSVVLYIQNTDELTITELFTIFTRVSSNLHQTVMTTAEQLISRGINQGISQGISQGAEMKEIDAIKRGYSNGISIELLSNILNLPVQKVEEIIVKIKSDLL
ncbi:putative transposase/invertase (TIGR01784 family) [Arcicella aurantiaca]|uniref:Putative transposase/invertase (TIGR01784 family) n=1 Tax=Arcicella aurantiaca TaxID=591202 RepID=A0A316DGB5_9BACT|nr:Rpn family recombination-promoting nuclease/putative transposase [Arcicella aurantiaca]PWK16658.1 putative transposase/invertase (TIGR01784 family) [Arcicella aurantiaca]